MMMRMVDEDGRWSSLCTGPGTHCTGGGVITWACRHHLPVVTSLSSLHGSSLPPLYGKKMNKPTVSGSTAL